tara:strand:- start:601 stop:1239 length:639 start_codon:yes stop_codon:yes gene_type:complete
MSLDVELKDGKGTGKKANIGTEGDLYVTNIGLPPKEVIATLRPFATLLTTDAGATDMRVSGTVAVPVDFYIQSENLGDRYIQSLAFTISDAGAQLKEFGNLTALTNGCQLIYEDSSLGDVIIAEAMQSNFDFVQLCNFNPSFGSGASAFLASNVIGTSEAYVPILDLTDVFGLPYGLRLPRNTDFKLKVRVRDTTTGVDRFDVKAFGFDRIE